MSACLVTNIHLEKNDTHTKIHSHNEEKDNNPYAGVDPLVIAYLFIFDSVQTSRDTAQIQAKEVQNNAVSQNNLINFEAQQNFVTLRWDQLFTPKGQPQQIKTPNGGNKQVAETVLQQLGAQNQEISAIRNVLEDKLNVLRQNAQVDETNLNSESNSGQQSLQEGGSLMQMLTSLTSQVTRI